MTKLGKCVGEGTFGTVFVKDGRASKVYKIDKDDGAPCDFVREVSFLNDRTSPHKHINTMICVEYTHAEEPVLVTTAVDHDLRVYADSPLPLKKALSVVEQMLLGVAHIHSIEYFHRDIKPANVLIKNPFDDNVHIYLNDFGTTIPFVPGRSNTIETCTLWYRAPEVLLGMSHYDQKVDEWSVGLVFAELLLGEPFIYGKTAADVLEMVFRKLGSPSADEWPAMPTCATGTMPRPKTFVHEKQGSFENVLLHKLLRVEPPCRLLMKYHTTTEPAEADVTYTETGWGDGTNQINHKMRTILIEWLSEVFQKFKLLPTTLAHAATLLDVYVSGRTDITTQTLQLVGCAVCLIACKLYEVSCPESRDWVYVCANSITRDELHAKECDILLALNFTPRRSVPNNIKADVKSAYLKTGVEVKL